MQTKAFPISLVAMMLGLAATSSLAADAAAGEKNAYPWGQQGSEQSEQDPAGVPDPWGQQGSEGEGQAADPWDELSQEGSSE